MAIDGQYRYAYEKFESAVYLLAVCPGDVRDRLRAVWAEIGHLTPDHLPSKLHKDFNLIDRSLNRFEEMYPGQLAELNKKEAASPGYKQRFPNHWPTPIEATLRRIKNSTGSKIARIIYKIYSTLDSMDREP